MKLSRLALSFFSTRLFCHFRDCPSFSSTHTISPVSALSLTLDSSSSLTILLEKWVLLCKGQFCFDSRVKSRNTILLSAATFPGIGREILATAGSGSQFRWDRDLPPWHVQVGGCWEAPSSGCLHCRDISHPHLCVSRQFWLLGCSPRLFHPIPVSSTCYYLLLFPRNYCQIMLLSFFSSPSLISFLGRRASQISLHPLTHMHAHTHTLYRKCLLMRGQ